MGDKLRQWVIEQLSKSGWTMNELARRSKLSSGYVSQVLSGTKEPGPKFYQGISRAFSVSLESVERLEQNGAIPQSRVSDPVYLDLMEIAQVLADNDLQEVRSYADYRLKKIKRYSLG